MRDVQGLIKGSLNDPDEGVRRAAVGYLLTMSRQPTTLVRTLLDACIESGTKEDSLLAALHERLRTRNRLRPPC